MKVRGPQASRTRGEGAPMGARWRRSCASSSGVLVRVRVRVRVSLGCAPAEAMTLCSVLHCIQTHKQIKRLVCCKGYDNKIMIIKCYITH